MFGMQKGDNQIQKDVSSEILWDPRVSSSRVSVSAKDGIVTLRGSVPHYFEKGAAEDAAQRVGGVIAVADELEVRVIGEYEKTDEDIAEAAALAMKWSYSVPKGIKITVDRGLITLNGEVDWDYERNEARDAVSSLMGVTGVINLISIRTTEKPADVKKLIETALKRSADDDAQKINVEVSGDKVTLSGTIRSFAEGEDARIAAWNAPGITHVTDNLVLTQ